MNTVFHAFILVCGLANEPRAEEGCFQYYYQNPFKDKDSCAVSLPALIPSFLQFMIARGEDLDNLSFKAAGCEQEAKDA